MGDKKEILDADISELRVDIEEFVQETQKIHNDFLETVNNINLEFRSVDSIFSKHHRQKKMFKELESNLNELIAEAGSMDELDDLKMSLQQIKPTLNELGKSKRKTGSYFVSLLMGKVSVRIWNKGDRYKFKSEYNRFKERWISLFFVLPGIQIFFGFSQFMHQLQALLFFFYYTSLAIRENILSLNGSRILPWWIVHHYWTMLVSVLSLVIYSDNNMDNYGGALYLNYFFFYQGIVMVLQNDYQKKRHYARKALAKKNELDIRTTEVIDERPHSIYRILIPALYVTYFAQLLISIYFLMLSSYDWVKNDRLKFSQVILMSIAWFVLSIGNSAALSQTLKKKKSKQRKQ